MTTLHFKIVLRKDYLKKSGKYSICLRIISGRIPKLFPLTIDCLDTDFDPVKQIIKKTDPDHFRKNALILKAKTKASDIAYNYLLNDKNLPPDEFTRAYTNDNYGSVSFYEYIEYLVIKRDSELSADTLDHYRKQLSKLKKFRPSLTFSEVNEAFILDYKEYMIRKLKNTPITWNKGLEFIKRVCNQAYKEGKIKENPFKNLQINRLKGNYGHLTVDELIILNKIFKEQKLPVNLLNVLRYFLFACYTGLRYRDILDLRFIHVKTLDNITFLDFSQHKTKKGSIIPLIDQAKELIPFQEFEQQRVFKVKTDQDTNRKLKDIMTEAKINKRITFHSARHTCSNALFTLDIPLDVRSMIIGDTKEVITKHYTEEDINMKLKALNKYSLAMKAKKEPTNQEKEINTTYI
ncbi:MAG: site-specific integrase [Bacteroidota bacterium]